MKMSEIRKDEAAVFPEPVRSSDGKDAASGRPYPI